MKPGAKVRRRDDGENTSKQSVMTAYESRAGPLRFGWRRPCEAVTEGKRRKDHNLLNLLNFENDFQQNCEKRDRERKE